MKIFQITCIFVAFSLFAQESRSQVPKLIAVTDGHDLSLPASVQPLPGFGMSDYNPKVFDSWMQEYPLPDDAKEDDVYFIRRSGFNWFKMNPAPGVYDWEDFDATMKGITSQPHVGFGLSSSMHSKFGWGNDQHVPDFVNITYLEQTTLGAIWEEGTDFFDRYLEFLTALRQRIDNTPSLRNRMRWLNVSAMDYMYGEGNFRSKPAEGQGGLEAKREHYQQAVATGMTPETYLKGLKRLIDTYSEAFAGQEHLLVWNNWVAADGNLGVAVTGDQAVTDAFWKAKGDAYKYALAKGWGGRDGQIEVWTRYLSPGYGNYVNDEGYLIYDNDFPISKENRVSFSENENYSEQFGKNKEYRFQASTFRLLQLRRNIHRMFMWMGLNDAPTAPVARYSQLSMGRRPNDSIDAWCWLRESYPKFGMDNAPPDGYALKNFERWVLQRDVADGMTRPAEYVDGFFCWTSARQYDHQARQTDYKTNNNSIYFKVEDVWFGSEPCDVMAFITFFDSNDSAFKVEYSNQNGVVSSPVVRTGDSGIERTAILELPDFVPDGAFASDNEMDFRILRVQGGDAVIKMVRLVKSTRGNGFRAFDDFKSGTFAGGKGWASPWRRIDIPRRDRANPVNPCLMEGSGQTHYARISRGGRMSRTLDPVLEQAELSFDYFIQVNDSPALVVAEVHDGFEWHTVWEENFRSSPRQPTTATIDLTSLDQVEKIKFRLESESFGNRLKIASVTVAGTGPSVNAGSDQVIESNHEVTLDGEVRDDGLPEGTTIWTIWQMVSGPGTVTFANNRSLATKATFSAPGTYLLRLKASDGEWYGNDEVEIHVQE